MSKERLIEIIIKAKFGENPDAKLYEPVSTDVLFLLQKFYDQVAMSIYGFIYYGYSKESCVAFVREILKCKTLNEDGSPTKIKEWSEQDCKIIILILELISKNI